MKQFIALCFVLLASATAVPPARGQDTPRYGGTLVFAIGANPETLNVDLGGGMDTIAVACKMFNGLIYRDRDWRPQPELAESWTISRDGLTYTFELVKTARWHDGKPFTSADVKFTFEQVLAKFHPRTRLALANVDQVQTPDPHTVVVRLKKPYAPFLEHMTCQEGAILPKHVYEGTDILKNPHNLDDPIGTGPFRWHSWTRGDRIVMVRNDAYFRSGLPYLDRLVAKIIPDPVSRILGLEAGEVDYIQSYFLLKQEVARFKTNPNVKTKQDTDVPGNYLLFFNVKRKPLDDKRVRHALAMGVNRQQILEQAIFGLGSVGKSAVHAGLKWAHNPDVDYSRLFAYDPVKANTLLDGAGLPRRANGTRFTVHLLYNVADPGFRSMAEIIRSNWHDLGVEVILEALERQLNIDKLYTKGDFDVSIQAFTTAGDPAIGITRAYATATVPPRPFTNPTGYSNPKLDELFARGVTTPFRDERQKAYFEAQQIIAEDLPALNLIDRTEVDVASVKFRGLWVSAQPFDRWDLVWWVGGSASR